MSAGDGRKPVWLPSECVENCHHMCVATLRSALKERKKAPSANISISRKISPVSGAEIPGQYGLGGDCHTWVDLF